MAEFKSSFEWTDEEELKSQHGEGVSRPVAGAETQQYWVRVHQKGTAPMFVRMWAESEEHAVRYAQARWPSSVVRAVSG
mgnify:FL=1